MQYRANVIHLAQQKGSKLRAAVRVNTDVVGKADHFDRVGKGTAKKKTSRHADTPLMNTPHSRRRVTMDPYEYADLVDKSDKVRLLISPESEYVIAGANAMGRAMDDVIIAAATGNSVSVDEDEATATVALGAGQQIAHGSAGMTVAKLRRMYDYGIRGVQLVRVRNFSYCVESSADGDTWSYQHSSGLVRGGC